MTQCIVVNFVGPEDVGKVMMAGALTHKLKHRYHLKAEYIPSIVKLYYLNEMEEFDNIHLVATKLHKLETALSSKYDILIMASGLVRCLYENKFNPDAVSDKLKTIRKIYQYIHHTKGITHIAILLKHPERPAPLVDLSREDPFNERCKELLNESNIYSYEFEASIDNIDAISNIVTMLYCFTRSTEGHI